MSTRNYESSNFIDLHKLRKKAAKATGCHHQFSKKKMRAPPAAAEEVIQEHEEEETMKKVCQETRLDDLSERIPPLAALLSEMTANNDVGTRDIADELATELQVWKLRLEEAIAEFEIDTAACTRSEQQLERLGELNELVRSTIKAHNKRPKSAAPQAAASENELIRFSSFAGRNEPASSAVEPSSSAVAVDAVVDPFQSSFDPFGVGEQDAKSKVMSLYHQGDAQQQQQTQQIQQIQQMQVAAPATGFTDPFAPYHAQDPFMPVQQMQQIQPQPAQQMQPMQMQMQQQALSVQKKEPKAFQVSQFDPFAPIQQSA